jgi:hypothetical protein
MRLQRRRVTTGRKHQCGSGKPLIGGSRDLPITHSIVLDTALMGLALSVHGGHRFNLSPCLTTPGPGIHSEGTANGAGYASKKRRLGITPLTTPPREFGASDAGIDVNPACTQIGNRSQAAVESND